MCRRQRKPQKEGEKKRRKWDNENKNRTGRGDSDDATLAPPFVEAFERRAHHLGVANAFKRVVQPGAIGLPHRTFQRVAVFDVLGVDKVGHAELSRLGFLGWKKR